MVFLGLGSNLGERRQLLEQAISLLEAESGHVVAVSSFVETEPWGFESQHRFLNAVVALETPLAPYALLELTQDIERRLGRTEKTQRQDGKPQWDDRPIDIDILLWDDVCVNDAPRLVIPHPLMEQRPFVMEPLREVRALLLEKENAGSPVAG